MVRGRPRFHAKPYGNAWFVQKRSVIDGNGPASHLSIFSVDEDGNLTLLNANTISGTANGVAVVRDED